MNAFYHQSNHQSENDKECRWIPKINDYYNPFNGKVEQNYAADNFQHLLDQNGAFDFLASLKINPRWRGQCDQYQNDNVGDYYQDF